MHAVSMIAAAVGGAAAGLLLAQPKRRQVPAADARFALWPELAADKHQVIDLPLCRVLLMDDSQYPCWLVLVPRVGGAVEVIDLPEAVQQQLWREVAAACRAARTLHAVNQPCKLNVATLGNVVQQLHVHVTVRTPADPAWPGPCYGALPPVPLPPAAVNSTVLALKAALTAELPLLR